MKHLYIFFVLLSSVAIGQKLSVKGQVVDSIGSPLPSATVMILSKADSTLVNFGISNAQGMFEIKNLVRSDYWLKVTFVGFRTHTTSIEPPLAGSVIDVGQIRMQESETKLDEVVVQETIPVTVKQDTIEYNAAAFRTAKNTNVEDLLKKLPGIEVDNDGNISAQGEQVKRVTVDGKDFFGGTDPKLATKNLPADAINKVQVHDRKSDQALFSGIDDGQRQKSINLELKPEKRGGTFGSIQAGYGTDDRYQAKANLNKFDKGKQLSFLGMANNTNEQGFSMDEYMNFTGGSQQMMSGQGMMRVQIDGNNQNGVPMNFGNRANGVMKNYAGGMNFNNEFSPRTEVNGSYFYNHLDHYKLQSTIRENFLKNGKFLYDENSEQSNRNENHRLNVVVDHKIDSSNSIKWTTNTTYNQTDANTRSSSRNLEVDGDVINTNNSQSASNGTSLNVNSSLLYRHRFKKKGRTMSTNLQFGLTNEEREQFLDATYKYQGELSDRTVQQRNEQKTTTRKYGATFSYTEPLGDRKYLEARYDIGQNTNDVNRPVYDINADQEVFNDSLSNIYRSDYVYHRAGLNFKLNRRKYTMTIGVGMQNTHLRGDLEIQDVQIDRSFRNFLPVARFNYDFSNTSHFRFDYETSVQEPTIQQLQPVIDNRDQLNPYKGNPDLRPAYEQSWRVHYSTFDPGTFISFFMFADLDHTTNAITNSVTNENFVRTTMPVNVPNNTSVNTNGTVSFPLNMLKSRVSVGASWRMQRGTNILDHVAYKIQQFTNGGNVRYNFHYKEVLDINLGAQLSYQTTKYDFDQPDQRFLNTTYTVESVLTFLKNYQFVSGLEYLIYENRSASFRQSIPLVNLSVSRFFLKNNSGELRISASNILDKALGVNQSSSINYTERTTTNSLGRYFMVTFVYAINKRLNPMGARRAGPMMRVIR